MNEWAHNNVAIALDHTGKFAATIGGIRKTFGSLGAAKKAIDKDISTAVEARKALRLAGYGRHTIKEITVIRAKPPRSNAWRKDWEWVYRDADGHEDTASMVAFDTPENRAAMEAYIALTAKNNLLRESMKEAEETAHEKIVFTKADPKSA